MYKAIDDTAALSFNDEELSRAARLVGEAMGDFCPAPEDADYEFSVDFRSKMAALIKKQRFKESSSSALRGIVSTAAVLALCAGVWLGTEAEARADFKQWILTKYENSFVYKFFDGDSTQTVKNVEFGWLPEDCEKVEGKINGDSGYYLFNGNDGRGFVFYYTAMSTDRHTEITGEGIRHEDIEVNGQPADYYNDINDNNSDVLWWTDEKTGIAFELNSVLEKEEMVKIAENVKLVFE